MVEIYFWSSNPCVTASGNTVHLFCIFTCPFQADVEAVFEIFRMELSGLQSSKEITSTFFNETLQEFYKCNLP
jgi:hypothetical protein